MWDLVGNQEDRFSHSEALLIPGVFFTQTGADLLRLTRDDLIQICGLADGIRLNNALQARNVRPRLTLYICQEPATGEYCKVPKFSDARNFAVIDQNFKQRGQTLGYFVKTMQME